MEYLIDYSENSNLHGLKYIGEKERTLLEKLFWLTIFIVCVVFCALLIQKVWKKWNETPVIVTFAENTTPVWQIPYPAVTICLETKAMQTKYNFTDHFHLMNDTKKRENMTDAAREMYEDLSLICDDHLSFAFGRKISNGSRTVKNIKSVSPNLTETFFACNWQDVPKENCSFLFSPILTEEGLCYTFNMLPAEKLFRVENLHKDYHYLELSPQVLNNVTLENMSWNLETGYPENTPIETYPHRGSGYGAKSGMAFIMKTHKIALDYLCRGPVQGFKILLHNPAELPRLSQQYFRSPLSQEVVVAVKPNMMTTSDGLKPYLPERRKCYFPYERYLRYFKIYTQSNCEMECLSNFTYAKCGCVHFGLPHAPDMKVCNTGKVACMKATQNELVLADIASGLNIQDTLNDTVLQARKVANKCQCLPACTSIEYEAETSQANFDWKALSRANKVPISKADEDMLYSRVMVFFKEPQFITSRRSELYGQTDFLANCGGLLGLFMGFSILSVVEIVYFLSLRIICAIWRRNTNRIRKPGSGPEILARPSRSNSVGKQNDLEENHNNHQLENLKKTKRGKRNAIMEYLIDYTENSNLHGLKYIGEKERTLVEKLFWLTIFIVCVVFCSLLILKVWKKWNETPVIVSFAENTTPVWQIPYPAVTLCFETKAMQTKYNFTENFHLYNETKKRENMTDADREMYEDLSLVCDDHLAFAVGRKYCNASETVENIKSVAPNLTETFFGCKWQDIPKEDCSHIFSPILTEEGLCYTFNMLPAEKLFRVENLHKDYPYLEIDSNGLNNVDLKDMSWNLETGYPANTPIETYPHRGSGYGAKSGMAFVMKTKEVALDYLCRGPVQGFKILLHNPAELPRLSQQYFRSPLSQEVVVAVKPNMMTTSDGLKPYLPERRKCYFPYERYLRYFKVYTQSNCEMECLANFTNARCGCVHFGMPHAPDMKVCNTGKVACMKAAQSELVLADIGSGLNIQEKLNDTVLEARKVASKCQCLPACTSIEYEAETSQADYDWKAIFRAYRYPIPPEELDMLYARVMVFFKEPQFITSRRSELYGQTDFLANCGGLLGLFMGFSILSVVEIVYFLTLRLICVIWRRSKKHRELEGVVDDYKKPEKFPLD
ncbi:hypothetical protein ABMA28_005159 [Loxostege sticticalis]|uniref:Pickpocket protein 28 n=1 Tax=Loxostege sticticalis TaxID=481309 RepID=A0ABD0SPH2_LOXSC